MVILTLLYVPGDRPDRVRKALASPADGVIVDLEDAVAPSAKAAAREVLGSLSAAECARVQVRVNAVGTPWHEEDVAAVAALVEGAMGTGSTGQGLLGVRVPKARAVEEVRALAGLMPGVPLHLLLEDALGIERAYDLATAHEQVASLGLGEADLRSDLGVTEGEGLTWARSRVVVAARAAGLPPPLMSAWTHVADSEGLAASCRRGRAMGFLGRTAIHPAQLAVIESAFRPSDAEVARAREVVERVRDASEGGAGTVVLADGTFLDVAMVRAAQRTLELGERGNH